ncbi:MAG: hypothetical protein LBG94_08670, partial [Treponema sp.]|nr:hypothetical protein [Treponema sp.]
MTFDYPFILFAFAFFVPLIIMDLFYNKKISGFFKGKQLTDNLKKKLFASVFFFRLFLALAIIALAGPRWGAGYSPSEYYRGLDAVFAIDISRSMDIHDLPMENQYTGLPFSRLDRGLFIAREIISSLPGAR